MPPKQRLMATLPRTKEYAGANHFLDEAQKAATSSGKGCPIGYNISPVSIANLVKSHVGDMGPLWQRDPQHRSNIIDLVGQLLVESVEFGYDFTDKDVFNAIFTAAGELYSAGYRPMTVLGTTSEGKDFKRMAPVVMKQ